MDILKILIIIIISTIWLYIFIDRICKCVEHCSQMKAMAESYQEVVKNNKTEPEEKK